MAAEVEKNKDVVKGNKKEQKKEDKSKKEGINKDVKGKEQEKLKKMKGEESKGVKEKKQKGSKKEGKSGKKESKEKKDSNVYALKYIQYLMLTEKAVDNITKFNTLVFVVDRRVSKPQIKTEVEKAFEVKVEKVNTVIDRKGRKKAYVKLSPEYSAEEIATQLGMM